MLALPSLALHPSPLLSDAASGRGAWRELGDTRACVVMAGSLHSGLRRSAVLARPADAPRPSAAAFGAGTCCCRGVQAGPSQEHKRVWSASGSTVARPALPAGEDSLGAVSLAGSTLAPATAVPVSLCVLVKCRRQPPRSSRPL